MRIDFELLSLLYFLVAISSGLVGAQADFLEKHAFLTTDCAGSGSQCTFEVGWTSGVAVASAEPRSEKKLRTRIKTTPAKNAPREMTNFAADPGNHLGPVGDAITIANAPDNPEYRSSRA